MVNSYRAETSLILIAVIWGITYVVVKNAISCIEPFLFNALRFLLSAILLVIWGKVFRGPSFPGLDFATVRKGIILGIWLFLGFGFLTLGLVHTTASNAGFITGMHVVMVPFFSMLIMKYKPDSYTLMGVMAASLGLYFLTVKGTLSLNRGDIFALFGAVAFSFHVIYTGKYARQYDAFPLVVAQLMVVGLASSLCAFAFEDCRILLDRRMMCSPNMLWALSVVVFFATCFPLLAQTHAQKNVSPAKVALIYSLEPVFAAFSGYFWSGDTFTLLSLTGCALIFSGMLIVDLPKYRARIKIFPKITGETHK